jgi:protein-S-isoprenylcysteine O-methyltransferase Ste14
MKRWLFFVYGVLAYLSFMAVYGWFAGFVGNVFVPKSIDSAPAGWLYAVVVDSMLIGLFGVQHSIMARPWFKRIWTRVIPQTIERSTYVVISNVLVVVLMWQWRGIGTVVWDVHNSAGRAVLWSLFVAGWLMVPLVSLMISHFDLFGLRQVWLFLRGKPYTSLPFRTPMLYSKMRHPLYVGWAIAFWATPTMTLGHLFFAATLTVYMVMAARVEERDLVRFYGDAYRAYQRRVRMFFPRLGEEKASPKAAAPVAEAVWRVPQLP